MENYKKHSLYKSHTFESIFGDTFRFYGKHFLSLYLIAFVCNLIIQFFSSQIDYSQIMLDPYDPDLDVLMGFMGQMVGIVLVSILFSIILNLFLFYYVIQRELQPERSTLSLLGSAIVEQGIPFLVISLVFGILMFFGVFIGVFLFIIGALAAALYVGTVITFAGPNLITEKKGLGTALGRSFDLAHRQFWSSLGYILVMVILLIIVGLLLSSVLLAPFAGSFFKMMSNPGDVSGFFETATSPWYIVLAAAVGSLTAPVFPIFATALYFKVKKSEDDGEPATQLITDPASGSTEGRPSVDDLMPKNRPENDHLQ